MSRRQRRPGRELTYPLLVFLSVGTIGALVVGILILSGVVDAALWVGIVALVGGLLTPYGLVRLLQIEGRPPASS
jgi:hypothetical protein